MLYALLKNDTLFRMTFWGRDFYRALGVMHSVVRKVMSWLVSGYFDKAGLGKESEKDQPSISPGGDDSWSSFASLTYCPQAERPGCIQSRFFG